MQAIGLYAFSLVSKLLPATRLFGLKRWLLRLAGAKVGNNVRCASSARFQLTGPLQIGADTWIGHEVLVVGGDAPVEIGACCDIAPRVLIATGTHQIAPHAAHVTWRARDIRFLSASAMGAGSAPAPSSWAAPRSGRTASSRPARSCVGSFLSGY